MHIQIAVVTVLLMLLPAASQAYVDPGLISAMYQLGYMAVAALAAAFIFRPWEYLKARFRRLLGKDDVQGSEPGEGVIPEGGTRQQDGNEQD